MPADHPLDPFFRVPDAWSSAFEFYATVGRLTDDELKAIGNFLHTSGPLIDQPEVVARLQRLGGRERAEAEVYQMIQEFEWSKNQVSWGVSPVAPVLERLRSQGDNVDAPHAVRIVFFGFGDRKETQLALEAHGFEHLLSSWNEEGWSGRDADWVMHVRRVQPVTEAALTDAVALVKAACIVSDIDLSVGPAPA